MGTNQNTPERSKKQPRLNSELLGSEFEVQVEKLAVGGWGIARIILDKSSSIDQDQSKVNQDNSQARGIACFIMNSAPQDKLSVKISAVHKNHLEAEILKVLKPGPERVEPPCPQAFSCGGCDWQHLNAEAQLKEKQNLLQDIFKKFLPEQSIEISPIVNSPKNFHYRSRIQPKVFQKQIGFFAKKSHELVPVEECLLAEKPLNSLFAKAKKYLDNSEPQKLEFYLDTEGNPQIKSQVIPSLSQKTKIISYENIEDEIQSNESFGFSQVNRDQNKELISYVLKLSENQTYSQIYDLYAGSGNFTFPLSEKFKKTKVTAVEKFSPLAQLGRESASNKPIQFVNAAVENFLRRNLLLDDSLVLLDPPRGGAESYVMKSLAHSKVKKIIYISCNPVTLARDLALFYNEVNLRGRSSYQIHSVQPFEMFPQTSHMEVIVELVSVP